MALSLDQIRARLQQKEQNKGGGNRSGGDNASFPFWDIPEGKSASIRFLPDGDPNAEYFWQERLVINLTFPYVKGAQDSKPAKVVVPCLDMWPDLKGRDPILQETKKWWDEPDLVDMARRYYKKKSYVFQAFVVDNPIAEDRTPENPIRRLVINPTIFEIIKAIIMNPDVEHLPTDYDHGREFRVTRTKRGQYSDYSTSTWGMRERSLSAQERDAIEKFGLFKLSDFLPNRPTDAHIEAIKEMFQASVAEEPYDPSRWGEFYRPYGVAAPAMNVSEPRSVPVRTAAPAPAAPAAYDDEPAPWATKAATPADDILARVRSAAPTPAAEPVQDGKSDAKAILDIIRQRQKPSA
jgi:hypothetical protein